MVIIKILLSAVAGALICSAFWTAGELLAHPSGSGELIGWGLVFALHCLVASLPSSILTAILALSPIKELGKLAAVVISAVLCGAAGAGLYALIKHQTLGSSRGSELFDLALPAAMISAAVCAILVVQTPD